MGYCNGLCLSVCQLLHLLLNHLMKSNQIWCVHSLQTAHLLFPPPWEGQKVKYNKISITKSISKIFRQNFLFPHMKDIKFIRRDFHSDTWVMPKGWDLGVPWEVGGGKQNVFQNSTSFGLYVTYMNGTCNGTLFRSPTTGAFGEEPKGQI